jgi:hypothetical protein
VLLDKDKKESKLNEFGTRGRDMKKCLSILKEILNKLFCKKPFPFVA